MSAPILVLDVDGVIIEGFPRKRWDADVEQDFGIRPKLLQKQFFKPHWRQILIGELAVEQPLADFLGEHAPDVTVTEFLGYWHGRDAHLRDDVIEAALAWKQRTRGSLAIATNQDKTRANYLRETLGLAKHMDYSVISCEVGALKPEPGFFEAADTIVARQPDQAVTFLDDLIDNVEAARVHGWSALQAANPDEALAIIGDLDR